MGTTFVTQHAEKARKSVMMNLKNVFIKSVKIERRSFRKHFAMLKPISSTSWWDGKGRSPTLKRREITAIAANKKTRLVIKEDAEKSTVWK